MSTGDTVGPGRGSRVVERAQRDRTHAQVENLFGEEYEEAAGFPAPDRRLVGGFALKF